MTSLRTWLRRWLGVDTAQKTAEMAEISASAAMNTATDAYEFAIGHVQTDHKQRSIGAQSSREDATC